jgi:sugar lactone lactonase YvrE
MAKRMSGKNAVAPSNGLWTSAILALALSTTPGWAQSGPVIVLQPASQTNYAGASATLNVSVTGTGPFTYQWRFNGADLPNDIISTVAGGGANTPGNGLPATEASLDGPIGLAVDSSGNLFVAEDGLVRKVDNFGIISTVAGGGTNLLEDGDLAIKVALSTPQSLAVDPRGNLFIVDGWRQCVRKVDTNGVITTLTNRLIGSDLGGLAADWTGNLFVANGDGVVKIDIAGAITAVAGGPSAAFSLGDGGAATNARLGRPYGLAADQDGNLFIADITYNLVRKVDTNGIITTVAGTGNPGYSGDGGPATNATISPSVVAVDGAGNLFFGDLDYRVRKVDTNGIITTVAGNGLGSYNGDGEAATNAGLTPFAISVDAAGNLFIADQNNGRVRKVALAGSPELVLENVSAANDGEYQVVVSGPSGSVTSAVAIATVTLPPLSAGPNSDGSVVLTFTGGEPNTFYTAEATDSLASPVFWRPISTNASDAHGTWSFLDTTGFKLPGRFYRVRTP